MHKVSRCLARYSPRATTTKEPTDRAPNEPALFPSKGRFCKKKNLPKRQKFFPHHTVGAPSASNSPRSLNARAGQQHWLVCRKWDSHIRYSNFGSSHFLAIPIFGIIFHIDFSLMNDDNHCIALCSKGWHLRKKTITKCSTLKIDFSANFHLTHDFLLAEALSTPQKLENAKRNLQISI